MVSALSHPSAETPQLQRTRAVLAGQHLVERGDQRFTGARGRDRGVVAPAVELVAALARLGGAGGGRDEAAAVDVAAVAGSVGCGAGGEGGKGEGQQHAAAT